MSTTNLGATPWEIAPPSAGNDVRIVVFLPDATNPTVGKTGIVFGDVTTTYCKPGESAFSAFPTWDTNNWDELGGGCYHIIIRQSDASELALLNTAGDILFSVAATGCLGVTIMRRVVPGDTTRDDTWTDTRAAFLDQLDGATDGTLCEVIKTCFTELSNRSNNSSLHDLLGVPDTAGHTVLTDVAAGAVASVTGDVGGKVLGGGSGTITGVGARAYDGSGNAIATAANQTTILARLGAWTGSARNTILGAFQALFRSDADATVPSDVNADLGAGAGNADNATDSTEALRDYAAPSSTALSLASTLTFADASTRTVEQALIAAWLQGAAGWEIDRTAKTLTLKSPSGGAEITFDITPNTDRPTARDPQ
jgi:hypothetical protein